VPYTTQQKVALTRVLQRAERPLTPMEICRAGKKEIPRLGIATVYRALKQLVEEGGCGSWRSREPRRTTNQRERQHHHFFFCRHCRHVYNLVGCVHGVGGLAPAGFAVEGHEIVLYGECAECGGKTQGVVA